MTVTLCQLMLLQKEIEKRNRIFYVVSACFLLLLGIYATIPSLLLFILIDIVLICTISTNILKKFLIGHSLAHDVFTHTLFFHGKEIRDGGLHILKEDKLRDCMFTTLSHKDRIRFYKKVIKLV